MLFKRMLQLILLGFVIQCAAVSLIVMSRSGRDITFYDTVFCGAVGFILLLIVTFLPPRGGEW